MTHRNSSFLRVNVTAHAIPSQSTPGERLLVILPTVCKNRSHKMAAYETREPPSVSPCRRLPPSGVSLSGALSFPSGTKSASPSPAIVRKSPSQEICPMANALGPERSRVRSGENPVKRSPTGHPVAPWKPRKLLVFYRTDGFPHASIPHWNKCLELLGQKTGAFTVTADAELRRPHSVEAFRTSTLSSSTTPAA